MSTPWLFLLDWQRTSHEENDNFWNYIWKNWNILISSNPSAWHFESGISMFMLKCSAVKEHYSLLQHRLENGSSMNGFDWFKNQLFFKLHRLGQNKSPKSFPSWNENKCQNCKISFAMKMQVCYSTELMVSSTSQNFPNALLLCTLGVLLLHLQ